MPAKITKTVDERRDSLTPLQLEMLEEISKLRDLEQSSALRTKRAVALALRHGIPATVLARQLGVSRPRIYQIKTEASEAGLVSSKNLGKPLTQSGRGLGQPL